MNKSLIVCIKLDIIRLLFTSLWYMYIKETHLRMAEEIYVNPYVKKMARDQIIKYLKEILSNKNMIQKVRNLNFDKKVQLKYERYGLIAKKDEELEYIILRNRHLGRLDRDGEEKIIDEI